ncbi:KPN_02809 family neutral zinc metallopeptidase [Pontivivens nitratireducens]|uniref:KPN_02809 family neutral zinc metallopeptidase n=1 Tax=Pontivivens nitratireducens TaxID=2758038 RepID=UPI00163AE61F|nr:neutral zinc metallopeptidase [Pontibrevibacter nitratireducens]
MKWRGRRASRNISDRRRSGGRGAGRTVVAGGGIGAVVVVLAGLVFGFDPSFILNSGLLDGGPVQQTSAPSGPNRIDDETEEFVAVVLADTEEVWTDLFQRAGASYPRPTLVLFSGVVGSACGQASSAVGPFYCPGDEQIYIDLDFFDVMDRELGARGDFAKAYVIAHEVAHHVQNVQGILPEVNAQRQRVSETDANRLTVRLELQADCYSGIWANRAEQMFDTLEPGDIAEAMNAAEAIGDDALQRRAQGYVVPDSFTHGTSEQRMRWFDRGYRTGSVSDCDTFAETEL